ncbi:M48 family metallopeptidase [Butyricimonas virosa]|jgi:STE24 endopeptidase|uniref:M48 family metallopeptidase n=1 Tax=Butyricimonas virosa TaxID=544645 RepID=A0ABX7H280_9BACT|nr:M48 family metallopeptidase [Butyricimonas virosa]MCI7164787.1 M48 family metallopeptidase [Butyricimonas virosa]MCI7293761.1 M48 family metallopeptidase [Butyricimonas virosa]MDY5011465.1 M48 family metallopeptidase [Butyricimonas virosa]MDY6217174.1 M48 family metallopeptidase [Butyricimonas virosa]QRO49114.1 M48 family metallopeptidase [Butyricimonas virosa]
MSSETIFFIIVVFLCLDFVLERVLESLNSKHMSPVLPDSLKGIYEEKEYSRFQSYKRENGRLDSWSSGVGFVVMIVFLVAGGFGWYNSWVVSLTDSVVWQTILFVVGLSVVSSVLDIPFDYYATFRIEEKYGFNKTTRRVYWLDTVKELFLSLVLGGVLLALVVWFYTWAGTYFWLYAWGAVTLFSVFMAMFYSQLIVPLFNKQTPLQEGSLRNKIQAFAGKVGFKLDNIYVIDGSKRSTKANAYFTGLGPKKRVVLYDTLIDELTEEEIVAVLAHEVGHYKKRHTLRSMVVSVIQMGVLFWLFSLCVNNVALSEALGGDRAYFQMGLIAFAILYSPVNLILGVGMNVWSRNNEYEADAFAARYYEGDYLVSGLKKISVKSLSNLTPHPLYEYIYYSHPSLLKRIDAIKRIHE